MDKRTRRALTTIVTLILGLSVATLYAARGRRVAVDLNPFPWEDELVIDFDDEALGGNHRTPDPPDPSLPQPIPVPVPIQLPLNMTVKLGNQPYNRVWINQNGFISLTYVDPVSGEVVGEPERFNAPGPASWDDVAGVVIAPFYADAVTVAPEPDCNESAGQFERCDVAYSVLLPPDPVPVPEPPIDRALRVTWGYGDRDGDGNPGLPAAGGDPALKNRFQLKLLDRSKEFAEGDFDIEFNYDGLRWETPNTLIGLRAGTTRLDIGSFFQTFVFDPTVSLPTDHPCSGKDDPEDGPLFSRETPLLCNRITIEVRNGLPKLATYTADVSVQLVSTSTTPIHTVDTFPLDVTVGNGSDDPATHVAVMVQLPNDTTLVSTTQGVNCAPVTGTSTCDLGTMQPDTSRTFAVNLRSTQDGLRTYTARARADQYDYDSMDDSASVPLTLAASADVTITLCTASPASATQGSSVTVTCTVQNNGPQPASAVVLQADLSAGLAFLSSSTCTEAGGRITCTTPSLTAGLSTAFSFVVNAASVGNAQLSVSVDAIENDPVANNNATASVSIRPVDPPRRDGGGSVSVLLLALLAGLRAFSVRHAALRSAAAQRGPSRNS
jgi:uncharacterized repeat protein (TIGR01451 family)